MKHGNHRFNFARFSLRQNANIAICRIFGHRIGETPTSFRCSRCGLCHEDIYFKSGFDFHLELTKFYNSAALK